MKKIYFMALALGAFAFTTNAQIMDDLDSYSLGDIDAQSPHWQTWSNAAGNAEDADVSDVKSSSGAQSLYIGTGNDMLLIFGDAPITTGIYSWQYEINADFDSTGFLGMMSASTTQFALQMYLNDAAEGSHFADPAGNVLVTFTLPEDQWVTHRWVIDLDSETVVVTQNEVEIYSGDFFRGALESCDIWDDDAASFYLDNVVFQEGLILNNNDFSADNFSVYPNPVRDVLNIQTTNTVDSVVVYDVLGKVVLSVQPDAISPRIDMSELSSGAYMVNVTIDGASKTVKVIK